MRFYKLLHIPSGLYYKPRTHGSPSNLSKQGKAYTRKPSLAQIGGYYTLPLPKVAGKRTIPRHEQRRVVASEWRVVEYLTK